jgi:ribosomal-protein-alanine N-acetyltransferase
MNPAAEETSWHIRAMRDADLEQVQAVDRASFSVPWPANAYRFELHENESSRQWVAEETAPGQPAKVVGVIVLWMILDEAHIATLSVMPEFRGRGIGAALLAEALKEGIRLGADSATLEVRAGNLAAQSLYSHFRFEVTGRRLRYYRDNHEDALIMTVHNLDQSYLRWLESGPPVEPFHPTGRV